jgi:hypothetical protein
MNALIEFAVEDEADVSVAGVPSTAVSVPWLQQRTQQSQRKKGKRQSAGNPTTGSSLRMVHLPYYLYDPVY